MVLAWLLGGLLVTVHTRVVGEYVGVLDELGGPGRREGATPLRQVIPARAADAQMWVQHALAAEEAGVARLRRTTLDNAPDGRDVHWSSAFAWLVRAAGGLQRMLTADGWPRAQERALLWFNAPLLIVVFIVISAWIGRRAGAALGFLAVCGLVGHRRFYEGFAPVVVDHHGLVSAAVLGLLLGVAAMGAGTWRESAGGLVPRSLGAARHAAVASAVCGGLGLWLSAAAVLPAIAWSGAAGAAVTLLFGRKAREEGVNFAPELWRLWGRVGAAASLACYLLEYAPAHLGWRLEVNHPLYALAWWGGAEVVAAVAEWRLGAAAGLPALLARLWLPALAVLAPAAALAGGGRAVFLVADPFVGDLRHFVAEGRTLAATVRQHGWGAVGYDLLSLLLLVPAGVRLLRAGAGERLVVGALALVAAGFALMGLGEMRWWTTGSAAQLTLVVVTVLAFAPGPGRRRWALVVSVAGLLFVVPAVYRIARDAAENRRHAVAKGDLLQPLYRDLAAVLRESQPEGEITLLAGPNAAAGISYFGRVKTLGTLYWENAAGLRAAAEILCAPTEEEARRLIQRRGVTHVVLFAGGNFVGEYFSLLHPGAPGAAATGTFAHRLMHAPLADAPRWLQPVAFRRAPELAPAGGAVSVFKVVPAQAESERLFHAAIAEAARGVPAVAEPLLDRAARDLPPAARAGFFATAGEALYEFGADAAAVRAFRRALAGAFDAGVANTAAWILATTADESLRDGRVALALVEPLLAAAGDDPTVLSTHAAACAEVGRFDDAVRAAERALDAVRRAGDAEAAELLQQRLANYRARKPWRQ